MHTPKPLKVAARPEGDPGRAFHHRDVAAPGGATTAEKEPLGVSLSDPRDTVTRVASALRTLRGQKITGTVTRLLAELVAIEVPHLPLWEIGELVAPPILVGCVLDEAVVMDRARNIATVAIYGGGR